MGSAERSQCKAALTPLSGLPDPSLTLLYPPSVGAEEGLGLVLGPTSPYSALLTGVSQLHLH